MECLPLQFDSLRLGHTVAFKNVPCSVHVVPKLHLCLYLVMWWSWLVIFGPLNLACCYEPNREKLYPWITPPMDTMNLLDLKVILVSNEKKQEIIASHGAGANIKRQETLGWTVLLAQVTACVCLGELGKWPWLPAAWFQKGITNTLHALFFHFSNWSLSKGHVSAQCKSISCVNFIWVFGK